MSKGDKVVWKCAFSGWRLGAVQNSTDTSVFAESIDRKSEAKVYTARGSQVIDAKNLFAKHEMEHMMK
jgi:hypothetical protein